MNFEKQTIQLFLDELASDAPAPGGGSVAALGAALGAALATMVANLTVGREKYKESWDAMAGARDRSEPMRKRFVELMNEDTEAFNAYMAAMKLPKETDEEKAARRSAMEKASKGATKVPLETLELCVSLAETAHTAMLNGNPNAASDAGVAALYAQAAGKAAALNVRINLPSIKDETFAAEVRNRMTRALDALAKLCRETEDGMDKLLG